MTDATDLVAGGRDTTGHPPTGRTATRRRNRRNRREMWTAFAFLSPWFIGFGVFTGGAMVASLVLSFTNYDVFSKTRFVGLDNYRQMLADPKVATALANTFVYAVMYVPTAMVLSLVLALMLNRVGRAAGFFRTVYYLPKMTPAVAVGALFLLLLNGNNGLVNAALGLIGVDGPNWTTDPVWIKPGLVITTAWGVGGTVVIHLAALREVPKELYEAAALDGAGAWSRFWRITVPMISPALFFTLIVQTIAALQIFDEAFTMYFGTSAARSYSSDAALFYVVYLFQQAFQFLHLGYASALAWLLFAIIVVITLIQVRVGGRFVHYEGERS